MFAESGSSSNRLQIRNNMTAAGFNSTKDNCLWQLRKSVHKRMAPFMANGSPPLPGFRPFFYDCSLFHKPERLHKEKIQLRNSIVQPNKSSISSFKACLQSFRSILQSFSVILH